MTKVALFFGSFDPVHQGHTNIATCALEQKLVQNVWFVLSPQSPAKVRQNYTDVAKRFKMLAYALRNQAYMRVEDIETKLQPPYYSVNTLSILRRRHTDIRFYLLMGEDNWLALPTWKSYDSVLRHMPCLVYARPSSLMPSVPISKQPPIHVKGPLCNISASDIRQRIKENKDCAACLDNKVWQYIQDERLYK